jgi:hypothetical protein
MEPIPALRLTTAFVLLVGLPEAVLPPLELSAQARPESAAPVPTSPELDLIRKMVGTWDVRASLWLGPDAKAIVQSAVARRRLVGEGLLEEVMTPSPGSDGPAFTRVAWLGHNAVTGSYEYVSWDTRAPQMMYQTSRDVGAPGANGGVNPIWFYLRDNFVVPQWGDARNVAFRQRLLFEPGEGRQVVRLYWTQLGGEPSQEFLAGEYVYTRRQ